MPRISSSSSSSSSLNMEKERGKNPSFLEMVLGWRRAFWNSITKTPEKDHHHHHHQTPPSAENANPTQKIQSMFGLLSNPSTPNHGSEPGSAGLREGSAQTEKTPAVEKDEPQNTPRGHSTNSSGTNSFQSGNSNSNASTPPAATAQIVGWPPVRSYKKNTSATTSKNNDEVDGKPGSDALFVKVSMDGAPYLKKVDLRSYNYYQELSSALEKMFATSFSTLDQCGLNSNGASGKEMLSDESKLKDLLQGKEYVLAYEDKDGDWMFVGDVLWETFIGSCKRLKIIKNSDAIGLAPRVIEKSKNRA